MKTKGKLLKPDDRDLFEATGNRLFGWDARDYDRNYQGKYTWSTQRCAYEIWCEARNLAPKAAA